MLSCQGVTVKGGEGEGPNAKSEVCIAPVLYPNTCDTPAPSILALLSVSRDETGLTEEYSEGKLSDSTGGEGFEKGVRGWAVDTEGV